MLRTIQYIPGAVWTEDEKKKKKKKRHTHKRGKVLSANIRE